MSLFIRINGGSYNISDDLLWDWACLPLHDVVDMCDHVSRTRGFEFSLEQGQEVWDYMRSMPNPEDGQDPVGFLMCSIDAAPSIEDEVVALKDLVEILSGAITPMEMKRIIETKAWLQLSERVDAWTAESDLQEES